MVQIAISGQGHDPIVSNKSRMFAVLTVERLNFIVIYVSRKYLNIDAMDPTSVITILFLNYVHLSQLSLVVRVIYIGK